MRYAVFKGTANSDGRLTIFCVLRNGEDASKPVWDNDADGIT